MGSQEKKNLCSKKENVSDFTSPRQHRVTLGLQDPSSFRVTEYSSEGVPDNRMSRHKRNIVDPVTERILPVNRLQTTYVNSNESLFMI